MLEGSRSSSTLSWKHWILGVMNSFTGGGGVFGRVGPVFLQVFVREKMLIYCFTRKKTPRFFFFEESLDFESRFFLWGFQKWVRGVIWRGGGPPGNFWKWIKMKRVAALEFFFGKLKCSTWPSGPFLEEHPEYWIDRRGSSYHDGSWLAQKEHLSSHLTCLASLCDPFGVVKWPFWRLSDWSLWITWWFLSKWSLSW